MGVNGLWKILASVKQSCSLEELRGKRLAVDLSGWICELSQTKQLAASVERPYIRNLFYRTLRLYTEFGVRLLFVVDGPAAPMKWSTMDKRMGVEGRGRRTGVRHQLNSRVRECCELLDAVGIPHVSSVGEAEALCALLNQQGVVDGVVSEDSDSLLYGAETIYRQLSVNKEGHVDKYTMSSISTTLGLNRRDLVAMAVCLGCDYMEGVPGIGKERVLKLVREESDLLSIIQGQGNSKDQAVHSSLAVDKMLRTALDKQSFRHEACLKAVVIDEYLSQKNSLPKDTSNFLKCRQPDIMALQRVCKKLLSWSHSYTLDKSQQLLSHWAICEREGGHHSALITPVSIVKQCIHQGVKQFIVQWSCTLPMITNTSEPESSSCEQSCQDPWKFMTRQDVQLMATQWPQLCQEYEQALKAKKPKPRKGKATLNSDSSSTQPSPASSDPVTTPPTTDSSTEQRLLDAPPSASRPTTHTTLVSDYYRVVRHHQQEKEPPSPVKDTGSSSDEEIPPLHARLENWQRTKTFSSATQKRPLCSGCELNPIVLSDSD